MGAALRKQQQTEPKLLQTKSLCYTIVKNAPRVLLPHSEAEKRKLENFDFVILVSSSSSLLSSSSLITQKPKGAYERSKHVKQILYYKRTCFFWIRAVCEQRLMCYYPKQASWSPFEMPFVHTFGNNLQTTRVKTFLNKNRVSRVGGKSKQTRWLTYNTVHFYNPTSLSTLCYGHQ